ncbi:MAG: ShlB/FhaC/HecB family hemolysin secretion/activation protein [Opitutales bacterium]
MPSLRNQFLTLTASLLAYCPEILAQGLPDAGTLQQQFEEPEIREIPDLKEQSSPDATESSDTQGITVTVSAFKFSGNTILDAEALSQAVSPFIGKTLDMHGLNAAAAAVGEAYQNANRLARVYLPRQEIVDGEVTLRIVEARFGDTQLESMGSEILKERTIEKYIEENQPSGEFLDLAKLNRAMLLLDDLPGLAASGTFVPGESQGETDLLLISGSEGRIDGEVTVDNYGSRATGEERVSLDVFLNSPLRIGDLVSASALISEGNRYGRYAYSLPVGYNGLRLGVSGSWLSYKITTDGFEELNIKGSSRVLAANAHYPLIRSRTRNVYLNTRYEESLYDNEASGVSVSNYTSDSFTIGLTANLFDNAFGGSVNFANITLSSGNIDLDNLNLNELPILDGRYTKLNYFVSRQQRINQKTSIYGAARGQFSDGNLDSSEKFYLGGPTGVRAYPANEGGGDDAVATTLELRYMVRPDLFVSGFYDWGYVRVNHDNPFNRNPNTYALDGGGIYLNWVGPKSIKIKATYARRISDNPDASDTGRDQDGSLIKNRFWLEASMPF